LLVFKEIQSQGKQNEGFMNFFQFGQISGIRYITAHIEQHTM